MTGALSLNIKTNHKKQKMKKIEKFVSKRASDTIILTSSIVPRFDDKWCMRYCLFNKKQTHKVCLTIIKGKTEI